MSYYFNYGFGWLYQMELRRICREFFGRFIGQAHPLNLCRSAKPQRATSRMYKVGKWDREWG